MKKTLVGLVLVVTILAFGSFAQATLLTFELDTEFSGATAPAGSAPWLTATFDDGDTAGSVRLTMEATNLTGSEFISIWSFNVDDLSGITFSGVDLGDVGPVGLAIGSDCCKADGDGWFDIEFSFASNDFTAGEQVVVDIFRTGLTAGSFDLLSAGDGNSPDGLLTAAHIQGIGPTGANSGWITGDGDGNHVPEPTTMLLLGSGLIGLGAFGRKLKK